MNGMVLEITYENAYLSNKKFLHLRYVDFTIYDNGKIIKDLHFTDDTLIDQYENSKT